MPLVKFSAQWKQKLLVVIAGLMVPFGTVMAMGFQQPAWFVLSVVGFIFFMVG